MKDKDLIKLYHRKYTINPRLKQYTKNQLMFCPKCKHLVGFTSGGGVFDRICKCGTFNSKEEKTNSSIMPYEEGVSLSSKNILSLYKVSREYYLTSKYAEIGKNDEETKVFFTAAIQRFSFNLNTGAAYIYYKQIGTKKFERTDWTGWAPIVDVQPITLKHYINELLSRCTVPVKLLGYKTDTKSAYYKSRSYIFELNGSKIQIPDTYVLKFVTCLMTAPNLLIRYDSYTDALSFRSSSLDGYGENFATPPRVRTSKYRKAEPAKLMDEGKYINYMIDTLGLPGSKGMRRLYAEHIDAMGCISGLMEMGIRHPDNLRRLYLDFFCDAQMPLSYYKSFIKALVKDNGETVATNKILKKFERKGYGGSWYLLDAIRTWKQIRKELRPALYGDMKEIHDKLAEIYNKMTHENVEIPYSPGEKKREAQYGDFKIKLAKDTHQLSDIATKMHHCVDTYSCDAVKKRCTIFYLTNSSEKYLACIEVKKNRLIQAKGSCNSMLKGEVANVVKAWLSDKGIVYKKCHDYIHMAA